MICGHFHIFTHDLNTCMHAKSLQPCPILCDPMNCSPPGSSIFQERSGVGCHALLQGIFPTQGSNPLLLNWEAGSLLLVPLKQTSKELGAWLVSNYFQEDGFYRITLWFVQWHLPVLILSLNSEMEWNVPSLIRILLSLSPCILYRRTSGEIAFYNICSKKS